MDTVNWRQVFLLGAIGASLTLPINILSPFIVERLRPTPQSKLVYSVPVYMYFEDPFPVPGVYRVVIKNEGETPADDVVCVISLLPTIEIEAYAVDAAQSLKYDSSVGEGSLEIQLPQLLPSEEVSVSILSRSKLLIPPRPQVSLRARGITGSEKRVEEKTKVYRLSTVVTFFFVLVVISLGLTVYALPRKKVPPQRD